MVLSGQEARVREAETFLQTADYLFENKYYKDCISRAYYAVYHITIALLAVKADIVQRRWDHDELHKAFLDNFFKRGFLFNAKDGEVFSELMNQRFDVDYHMKTSNRKGAERLLNKAKALIKKVKEVL